MSTKLQLLKEEYNDILDKCSENDISIYANKYNLERYNQAILVKDHFSRLKKVIFKTLTITAVSLIGLLIIYKSKAGSIFLPTFEIVEQVTFFIMTSVLSIETICQTLSYIKDLKKYQSMGKAYDYLTLEELYYKVMELKIKGKSLELDLEKNKQILNYLKEQIAKEIDEKAPIVLNHNFPSLTEEKKINYEHIYLNEYDMPKVKVKRRDEKCYKNQKGPMM